MTESDVACPIAIRCGRLLDIETGKLADDRVIHVDGAGRITAIGGASDGTPDDAEVLDLTGLTVLPGLIDVHTHLVGDVQTAGVPSTTTSAAEEALIGVRHARETIRAGFTSVRDLGSFRAFTDCALRTSCAGRAVRSVRASVTLRSGVTLRALRTNIALWTLRTGDTSGTGRASNLPVRA